MKHFSNPFLLWVLLLASNVSIAQGIYLFIPGVTDNSGLSKPHDMEVKLTSASLGLSNSGSTHTGGGGAGRADFQDYSLTKDIDKSSMTLMQRVADGRITRNIEIRYYSMDERSERLALVAKLTDCLIVSYDASGSDCGGGCPTVSESIGINFSKIEMENKLTSPPTVFQWDIAQNAYE